MGPEGVAELRERGAQEEERGEVGEMETAGEEG